MTISAEQKIQSFKPEAVYYKEFTAIPKVSILFFVSDSLLSIQEKLALISQSYPRMKRVSPSVGSFSPPYPFEMAETALFSPFLLIETDETLKARAFPVNLRLLRSLCRGAGVLKRSSSSSLYLEVDPNLAKVLVPHLREEGFEWIDPPHVLVIPSKEMLFYQIGSIEEEGSTFPFELDGLFSVFPTLSKELDEVWFLKVTSSSLESLRRSYFLLEKPSGHSFLMAVSTKKSMGQKKELPMMRINPACYAA